MFLPDLAVRSHRVVTPSGTRPAAIHVRGERIIGVLDFDDVPDGCAVDDVDPCVVLPGIVDTRVHVEDDFAARTRAAAAGGVTSIVVAPGETGPATTVARLEERRQLATGQCWVDVGFRGGLTSGNAAELRPLFDAGVFGFECARISATDLSLIRYLGATLFIHAGTDGQNDVTAIVDLCRQYQTATHIVQLSSSRSLTPLFHGRAAHLPLTAETCPHYLNLIAEELPDGTAAPPGTPPIGDRENREFLWAALANGLIHTIAADRFTPLELSLPLVWLGASGRNYAIDRLAEWMCLMPARLAGLARKGRIDVGCDADFVAFDPDAAPEPHRHHQRFYTKRRLSGAVLRTYLRGSLIYSRDDGWAAAPRGHLLLRAT